MQLHNWVILFVVAAAAYYMGAKNPGLLSRVGL